MNLDWSVIGENFNYLMAGAELTIIISILSIFLGFVGGIFIGMCRISKNPLIYYPSTAYVEAFRGTPLLIQIFLVYLGLSSFNIQLSAWDAGILALSLNSAAYQSEIFRGGIQSIPKGQMEAARSMGLTYNQSMFKVIIPQALRNALPPYTNEFCTMIKDSSLVSAISVMELTWSAKNVISVTFQPFVVYIFIAFLYFLMTFVTTRFMRYLEKRYAIPGMMGAE
ncbi:MAG: glutamine ABC transporter permease protein [Methanomassiliicoccales archaeon PtaU1.Bin124]|nr:MAG: glutamine ABC transporter permease protein [Methanomassiliicoccales archaeon PtaU1.Bin124]